MDSVDALRRRPSTAGQVRAGRGAYWRSRQEGSIPSECQSSAGVPVASLRHGALLGSEREAQVPVHGIELQQLRPTRHARAKDFQELAGEGRVGLARRCQGVTRLRRCSQEVTSLHRCLIHQFRCAGHRPESQAAKATVQHDHLPLCRTVQNRLAQIVVGKPRLHSLLMGLGQRKLQGVLQVDQPVSCVVHEQRVAGLLGSRSELCHHFIVGCRVRHDHTVLRRQAPGSGEAQDLSKRGEVVSDSRKLLQVIKSTGADQDGP